MPQTFDISQSPQNTSSPSSSGPTSRGTGTALDEYARTILWIAIIVSAGLLLYLGWGLYGNVWTNPTYKAFDVATRARHLANIDLVMNVLRGSSIVGIICVAICAFRDEGIGYVLCILAAIFYLGIPAASEQVFNMQALKPSPATQEAITGLQSLWWIYGVPGTVFLLIDIGRRFQAASENAAIQRANLKYGSSASKVSQKGAKFLGRCWELPYCREHVRAKCPIFIRRRGPCWWYKEGCMCEERIVLQAVIQQDWKEQSAAATQKIGLTAAPVAPSPLSSTTDHKMGLSAAAPKQILTPAAKRERCRKCIIYNEHQRQKYKLWVGIAVVTIPAVLYMNLTVLQGIATFVIKNLESVTSRFTLAASTAPAPVLQGNDGELLQNVLIVCLGLAVLSQALKFVEWLILKVKI